MSRLEYSSLYQLTRIRFMLVWREPEAIFWIFIFPILLAVGLGIAFRDRPPDVLPVGATTAQLMHALSAEGGLRAVLMDEPAGKHALDTGTIVLLAIEQQGGVVYQYDDTNPDARNARLLADRAVQAAGGQREAVATRNNLVHETGSRYIDFVVPGLLGMNLMGSAKTPQPSIYVSFRSFSGECANKLQCAVGVHDTVQGTGQGSHGSLSRAETRNFMAAVGPSFKKGYADPAPVSNADIAPTMAKIAGIELPAKGKLRGRVITEALPGGAAPSVAKHTIQSAPAENGARTILNYQQVGDARYFDAAGFDGKTVGLTPP